MHFFAKYQNAIFSQLPINPIMQNRAILFGLLRRLYSERKSNITVKENLRQLKIENNRSGCHMVLKFCVVS